ncbi:MAG: TolC family protein [Longimicrobiales bacterium]
MIRHTIGAWVSVGLLTLGGTGVGHAQELPGRAHPSASPTAGGTARGPGREASGPLEEYVPLAALLAEAEANNREIAAAVKAADAASARIPQAGAPPDPMVGIGFMNVPVADPLGSDMMTMTQVQVATVLPWPGKLGLREDVARLRADAAVWEVERVRDRVTAEVKQNYYRIYFVDRALAVTERNEGLMEDFARLTSARYGVGRGAQPDVLKAQVERTRLADQLVTLRRQREGAVARLNALLARPTETPVQATEFPDDVRVAALTGDAGGPSFAASALSGLVPAEEIDLSLPSTAELQALALENSPTIRALRSRVTAQETTVSLAEAAVLPDLSVSAGYSRRAGLGDFFSVMVSAPVPVFSGRKQDQAVVEEGAVLGGRRADLMAVIDDLNAEIASRRAELRRAREQLLLLDEGILPQARTGLESATAAYQVGNVDFLTLLDAQVTLYRHELDYHRLLADFADNLAALERAVGTEVLR